MASTLCHKELSSVEFVKLFKKFDTDGNGYIEKQELDEFLRVMLLELNKNGEPSKADIEAAKKDLLEKYDEDKDGRFAMDELEKILPVEENLLAQFNKEDVKIDSVDFVRIFTHYDEDKSGYLEGDELQGFFRELLSSEGKCCNPQRIDDYIEYCLEKYDTNKDGKFELNELARMLPVEENFFTQFEHNREMSREEFNKIFDHYDKDKSGDIEGDEITALLRDVLTQQHKGAPDMTPEDLEDFKKSILAICDINNDNKLSKDELGLLLSVGDK